MSEFSAHTTTCSKSSERRAAAVVRFYALWRHRFHCWLRMEDGAQGYFKVPPPSIDFTLPSPMLGQAQTSVADPPWMPHVKASIEELSLTSADKVSRHAHIIAVQANVTSIVGAKTRRKQRQEEVRRAMAEAERKQSEQRDQFPLRATPAFQQAAYEPALFTSGPMQQQQVADDDGCDSVEELL